jgi:hypothetical protein
MKFPLQIRDGETHTVRAYRTTKPPFAPGSSKLAHYVEKDESFFVVGGRFPEREFVDVVFDTDGASIKDDAGAFLAFHPSAFKEGSGSRVIEVVP